MSQSETPNSLRHSIKVVLLGDLGVGKTCLRSQYIHHVFSSAYKTTIGGDFLTTTTEVNNSEDKPITVNLQIWDTAGQERFNLISQAFYRGADVAVLVYDVTNYESLISLQGWWAQFFEHCHVDAPGLVIVGNKIDRTAEQCIDLEEVRPILCRNDPEQFENYVTDWTSDVLEVSCKQPLSVDAVFQRVALLGLSKSSRNDASRLQINQIDISPKDRAHAASCAC